MRKIELATLSTQLPGLYGNERQTLTIIRLAAPLVGDQVFYVRETATDDVRRVVSERVWSLDVAAKQGIVASVYAFDEPDRWRGGAESPELFRSLLMRDLRPLPECALVWQKVPQGFAAQGVSAGRAGSGGKTCPRSWGLQGDDLSFSVTDAVLHLVRQGGAG